MHVLKCFSYLLLCSRFDQKSLKFVKKVSFSFDVGLVGKLDWLFSHVFVQILCRAISEVKCFSLRVICKDGGSDPRTFFLLTSC